MKARLNRVFAQRDRLSNSSHITAPTIQPKSRATHPAARDWQVLDASGLGLGFTLLETLSASSIPAKEMIRLPHNYGEGQRIILVLPFTLGDATTAYEVSPAGLAIDQLTAWVQAQLPDSVRPRPILVWAIETQNRHLSMLTRDPSTRQVFANSWFLTGHWWPQRLAHLQGDEELCIADYIDRSAQLLRLAPHGPTLRNRYIDLMVLLADLDPRPLVISQSLGSPDHWHGLPAILAAVTQEERRLSASKGPTDCLRS